MDGNGKIDEYEFICSLAYFTKTELDDRIEAIFGLYDQDNTETCDANEFKKLIETLLSVNQHFDCNEDTLDAKIKFLNDAFFFTGSQYTLDLFHDMVLQDDHLRGALLYLGVFGPKEVETEYFDNDLEEEYQKYEDANLRDEQFENRKKGIEDELPDETGINGPQKEKGRGANQKWKTQLSSVGLDQVKESDGETPNTILALEYIHGYRCHDTRNNIFYNPEGKLLYYIGKVAVQLDTEANRQRFVTENQDDIFSMAVQDELAITGDIGDQPVLSFWNNTTMKQRVNFAADYIQYGIGMIDITPDGKLVAISCLDVEKSIIVLKTDAVLAIDHDEHKETDDAPDPLLFHIDGPPERLHDLKFLSDNKTLVMPTWDDLFFGIESTHGLKLTKATGWSDSKTVERQTTLCAAILAEDCVVGSQSGHLLRFKGTNLFSAIPAHKGPVNAIFSRPMKRGIISGGADGQVIVWDSNLSTKQHTIDIAKTKGSLVLNCKVRSVAEDMDGLKVAIGIRSGSIFEYNTQNKSTKAVMNCHSDNELWALSFIPNSEEFITCGEDFMVAKWNVQTRKLVKSVRLMFKARVCDVSPDGKVVAIGCSNGHLLFLEVATLNETNKRITDRNKAISEIKFSPDGKKIAVGSNDNRIKIYEVDNITKVVECRDHRAPITHIDWAEDASAIQSNSGDGNIMMFNPSSGAAISGGPSNHRNKNWDTWTCTYGWPTIGIWPQVSNGTDINAVDRSNQKMVLATGDDYGIVKLFKYPSIVEGAMANIFSGHSTYVTCVRFSPSEKNLVSIGATDKAVFQWRVTTLEEERLRIKLEEELKDLMKADKKVRVKETDAQEDMANFNKTQGGDASNLFMVQDMGEGEQYSKIKQYQGELRHLTPSGFVEPARGHEPPEGNLYLQHVFGVRLFDSKDMAYFLESSNKAVFITASLAVVMDTETHFQKFFNLHEDDVLSIAVSPDRKYCATGSNPPKGKSKEAEIYVWDSNTNKELAYIRGFHKGSVRLLRFSLNGELLLSFGKDKNHSLAIYDWKNERLICASAVDSSSPMDAAWRDKHRFVSVGKRHIKFWTLKAGTVSALKGVWGEDEAEPLLACKYMGKICITASWSGNLAAWTDETKGPNVKSGQGTIFCLASNPAKGELFSGGKDGSVKRWRVSRTGEMQQLDSIFDYANIIKKLLSDGTENSDPNASSAEDNTSKQAIRSLDLHEDGHLLVGLATCELIRIDPANPNDANFFMMSHFHGEVWGLACHPTQSFFVTSGGDKSIRMWDANTGAPGQSVFDMVDEVRALDWSTDGNFIVAVSVRGELFVFNIDLELKSSCKSGTFKRADQWIEVVKISPNCTMAAFGGHGGPSPVEVVKIDPKTLRCDPWKVISSELTAGLIGLDWSMDNTFVAVTSEKDEIKFIDISKQQVIRAADAKDINWQTWSNKLGFTVQGILPGPNSQEVNTACRSILQKNIVTGDDFQNVNLFRYPAVAPKNGSKRYLAHAGFVTATRFLMNDNALISLGGPDNTICIWATDFGKNPTKDWPQFFQGQDIDFNRLEVIKGIQPKIHKDHKGNVIQSNIESQNMYEFEESGFMVEEEDETNEQKTIEPWMETMWAPTNFTPLTPDYDEAPNIKMVLEYCYGYRSRDKRSNLHYLETGELFYHAAALGIIHDVGKNSQRFLDAHRDDCISIAVSPDGHTVATGELHARPQIYVWDAATCKQVCIAKEGLTSGVEHMAYSPGGEFMVAICADTNHKLILYESISYRFEFIDYVGETPIFAVVWVDENCFVTIGDNLYRHWEVTQEQLLHVTGNLPEKTTLTSAVAAFNKEVVCGTVYGKLLVWKGVELLKSLNAHEGVIDSIIYSKEVGW